MKRSYKDLLDEIRIKDYLLEVCEEADLKYILNQCITNKELKKVLSHEIIRNKLYKYAIEALYKANNYDELEYHLMHMNKIFDCSSFNNLKKRMFLKLTKKHITLKEYCVIRHLIDINDLERFLKQYVIDPYICSKIALLEDQYHLAYLFLKQLDSCDNEVILNLLASYSVKDYISLMMHYHSKKYKKEELWEKECFIY